jgi:hypothetical protein
MVNINYFFFHYKLYLSIYLIIYIYIYIYILLTVSLIYLLIILSYFNYSYYLINFHGLTVPLTALINGVNYVVYISNIR